MLEKTDKIYHYRQYCNFTFDQQFARSLAYKLLSHSFLLELTAYKYYKQNKSLQTASA